MSASASWTGFGFTGYYFTPGYFGFSPDGRQLASPGRFETHYDVATGAVLSNGEPPVLSRDNAWARELVSGRILELESRRVLLEGLDYPVASLSGDGRYYFWVEGDCAQGTLGLHRRSVDAGERRFLPLPGLCESAGDVSLAVTSTGSAALLSSGGGRLWHADFEAAAVSSLEVESVDAPARRPPSIHLSPDDHFVAVIGADGVLRTWSYPAFEPILTGVLSAWGEVFSNCYCRSLSFAPVAWSHDDSLLAAPDSEGHTVIRRACDGEILATLEPTRSGPSPRPAARGPIFLAFSPDDTHVSAAYEAGVVTYALALDRGED